MQCQCLVSPFLTVALLLVAGPVFAAEETLTLGKAETITEIQAYLTQTQQKANADLQTQGQPLQMAAYMEYLKTISNAEVASAKKILSIAKDDTEKRTGYTMLIRGLKQQDQLERMKYQELLLESGASSPQKIAFFTSESKKRLVALIGELEKNEAFEDIVIDERYLEFMEKMRRPLILGLDREELETWKQEAKEWVNTKLTRVNSHVPRTLEAVIELAGRPNLTKDFPGIVDETIKELIAFINSDECTIPESEKKTTVIRLEGEQKRSIGVELNLYGRMLEGEEFDWKALRGKYVLVKFTATWCGPCKGEIPGMLKAYEQYKDKDFEIVSVYIWEQNPEAVAKMVEEEKLPWVIIVEDLTVKAGLPKQGDTYAIRGVPTMLLIDKEGKVISTTARGAQLEKLLEELL